MPKPGPGAEKFEAIRKLQEYMVQMPENAHISSTLWTKWRELGPLNLEKLIFDQMLFL